MGQSVEIGRVKKGQAIRVRLDTGFTCRGEFTDDLQGGTFGMIDYDTNRLRFFKVDNIRHVELIGAGK